MSRAIKFRAWDSKHKRMYVDSDAVMVSINGDGTLSLASSSMQFNKFMVDNGDEILTPMQYTGLKDKNGKECYEGDVVRSITPFLNSNQTNISYEELGVIRFGEYDNSDIEYGSRGLGWYVEGEYTYVRADGANNIYDMGQRSVFQLDLKNIEVIGNIYENPDLLPTPSKDV